MLNIKPYLLFLSMLLSLLPSLAIAQQWKGSNDINGTLWRNGNVGVGISNPTRPFQLRGSRSILQIDRDTKDPGIGITRYSPGFGQVWKSYYFYVEGNAPNDGKLIIADWRNQVAGPSVPRLVVDNTGNVGIGTSNPQAKLDVDGNLRAGLLSGGSWPAGPNGFAFIGNSTLNHSNAGNYALLQEVNNGRTYLNSPTDIRFRIGNANRMILANNGNFGIGTINPSERLTVDGNILATGRIAATGGFEAGIAGFGNWPANPNGFAFFGNSNLEQVDAVNYALLQEDNGRTYLNSPVDVRFRINNDDRMVLTNNGLGIGTSNPSQRLTVVGNILATGQLQSQNGLNAGSIVLGVWPGNGDFAFIGNNTLNQANIANYALLQENNNGRTILNSPLDIRFRIRNGEQMIIANNGNIGIGTTGPSQKLTVAGNVLASDYLRFSDQRFKSQIESLPTALENVMQLRGVSYQYDRAKFAGRNFPEGKTLGLVAQEVEKVFPELVVTDQAGYKAINYDGLIPVLIEALKAQQSIIEQQKQDFETRLAKLEKRLIPRKEEATELEDSPAQLYQNQPNPFGQSTKIKMYLPEGVQNATLYIYNMQGETLKQMEISERGEAQIEIAGHTLHSGMYLYALIADGQEVAVKRMILTR